MKAKKDVLRMIARGKLSQSQLAAIDKTAAPALVMGICKDGLVTVNQDPGGYCGKGTYSLGEWRATTARFPTTAFVVTILIAGPPIASREQDVVL